MEDHPDLRDPEWGLRIEREFRREKRGKRGPLVGLAVALGVTGLVAGGLLLGGVAEGPAAPPAAATDAKVAVLSAPGIDFARPFAGTDFESWADGAAGVAAAPAHGQVREHVIRTWLDPALVKPGTPLLPNGVRAQGTITPAVADDGSEVVRSDHRFVYAFAPDGSTVIHSHDDFLVTVRAIDDYRLTADGPRVVSSRVTVEHAACSTRTDGLLAPQYLNAGKNC